MHAAPTSIKVISWILIVSGGISALSTFMMRNNPMVQDMMSKNLLPPAAQYTMSATGLAAMVVCGVFMLKGRRWARTTYVAWSSFGLVFGLATSPLKVAMIPGALFFLVVTFFLFRPKANAWFATAPGAPSDASA